ncbi:ABC transporter ATP-binding protein [Legionella taurinensis]|uniref:ATP-binding protein Uup n=1 Tax=Legionella taurinensis TaxID=70611 RepID=A0AB38N9Z7_9GAMM|nr:ATP-binding cassette domain-containing protein [Legionella taurinensis]MDX1836422.1 ATP-binding cassette domain-containing protein [Legionella taurinensis]PUT43106.1 ABC transporter ATP-binding protein [Legionella taurinensis]PUT45077.1 ABC transporter ATP-binding protein [Legionella taurinensis]PUT45661.1 ABC transporter ATP-binding protein [Legionella taurinensis]PUT49430.1 ABC transporter ATP-binding protein [Legionella taurinensis]
MSIVSLHGVSLNIAGNSLLNEVDWQIQAQDRIALVGRNGAGKSTLLRLLQGQLQPDKGQINRLGGLRVAGLTQEVPVHENESVYHFLVKGLGEVGEVLDEFHRLSQGNDLTRLAQCQLRMDTLHAWDILPRVEMMATRIGIDANARMDKLSGGMKRRALLAAALIAAPDLLLLDEPTNHLDVNAIEWLESYLKSYQGSLLVVTHDREFLGQVASRIVEVDRGNLYTHDCDYETYLDRREAMRLTEEKHNELFDKRLSEEEAWIRTGIKARRTRNEGRVRALKAMREEYKARRAQLGKVQSVALDVARSGFLVIEANQVNLTLGDKTLLKNFSLLLTRGDKVGIIGPNGCGKTTLIRTLLGELQPDSGTVRQGTSLEVAYFDQLRRQLNENETVMANVGDGADYVTINGKQKHVATYLREFLFPPERFNQQVSTLSGGERNRLLLAKLFAKPVNLLVMDEPTNDLDIETLELIETMLVDYPGTLLLISHDRAFINQVVTSVLVYEDEGVFNEYVGGYEDYRRQKKQQRETSTPTKTIKRTASSVKLSFNEQRELAQLPQKIEQLEEKINELQLVMANPDFYQRDAQAISQFTQELAKDEAELATLYARWEALEEKG